MQPFEKKKVKRQQSSELERGLSAVTNQLLDLGKRNRLLNYKDTGLKTLKLLNKNVEEIFRSVKAYRDLVFFDTDIALQENYDNADDEEKKLHSDLLHLDSEYVYSVIRKQIKGKELLAYKESYQLQRALKSLMKDHKSSLIEKGINPLYISFGFIHYIEDEITYTAPLLLISVELNNETGQFELRQYEDDILLNPTLKFYLDTAYGIDLIDYDDEAYSTYIEKLKQNLNDKVWFEDGVSLGIYSFYKMNMYNDLISNKDLVLQNKNIRALLGEPDRIEILDEKADVFPVVNCDSSQLEAIQNAANGKSFCLQGPPGSGKSQTITNMISTFLGQGKKILFVSEKIAALNVVFENLRRAKLSEFALELHSNKANKKEFIEKIYNAATLPRYEMSLKTRFIESKYNMLSNNLKSYEDELHENITGLDCTLLDLYSMYLGNDVDPLDIYLFIDDFNLFSLEKINLLFSEYRVYSRNINDDYRKSGLYGLNLSAINDLSRVTLDLDIAIKHIGNLFNIQDALNQSGLNMKFNTVMEIYNGMSIVEKINKIRTFSPYYFNKIVRKRISDSIEKYLSIAKNLDTEIFKLYDRKILTLDLDKLQKSIEENNKGLFKNKEFKEALAKVLEYRFNKAKPDVILPELNELRVYNRYFKVSKNYTDDLEKFLGPNYLDMNLKGVLQDLKLLDGIPDMQMTEEKYKQIKEQTRFVPPFTQFKAESSCLIQVSKMFYKKDIDLYTTDLNTILERLESIYVEHDFIYNYSELMRIVNNLKDYKCFDFLNKYLDTERPLEDIEACYEKTFVKQKIMEIHATSDRLSKFDSKQVDDTVNEFRDLDEKILNINRDYIIAKNSVSRHTELVEGSQFKLLDKEYNKLRRQLPIRTLLDKIFELALDIKPVFLMSPLSVSTYLASQLNMFDCVIFDEASQIFACDAFGSIYRGKQCIVIGDTKQMPPTSFFQASAESIGSQVEDEIVEEEYDLESILDKASNTFETKGLKWHYRSRTEELIVFSNKSFYDSNLITIPQSKHHEPGFGIDYVYVADGRYDMKTRTNPIEAQKICDMVFDHLDTSNTSVGVVAFSNVQAELIQSLIDKRLKKQPKYEKFFDPELNEPVFVKNLESVQGDERDRIIFSICYGFNEDNKFYQRFGPLNASGGERRLNVAVTRAKINITIVSSIHYSDVRDNPDSLGVTRFKEYLKFAENVIEVKNYSEADTGTTKSVTDYINSLGYDAVTNYGSSAFKVDIAVKAKDSEDYSLAIMIDGKNSYSTSLSDNYRLERMLLERQGWRYYKLFTTAWINNNEEEKERIKQAIEGTLVEGDEYQHQDTNVSYLKVEGNEDVIDLTYSSYDYLNLFQAKKFFEEEGYPKLVKELIRVESPIHKEYLVKRVAQILGIERITNELKENVEKALPERLLKLGDFYFNFKVSDIKLRLESDRDIQYVYVDELADGIYNTVRKNNGVSEAGCFKTIVNLLGASQVTANSKKLLLEALDHLVLDRKVEEKDGKLFVLK